MPAKYTRDRLAEAARASSSYDEVVRALGGTPTPGSRRYLRTKLLEAGIDTTHFAPAGVRHTEARLRELVTCSHSVAELVRCLGINPIGGNQAHIGRRIAELSLDTTHFTAGPCRRTKGSTELRRVLGSSSAERASRPQKVALRGR
ncbi:hypothetical protein ACIGT4_29575 [Streptomyces sioyaensis]|uniref:hypothetical protein n=1 Tax=Streptomyces sioyaensis TaxID=67364 RepID=UPI0037D51FB2